MVSNRSTVSKAVASLGTPIRSPLRWPAAFTGVVAAAAHLPVIPAHLSEAPYMGVLFLLLTGACLLLAAPLVAWDSALTYAAATGVCALAVLGYALTRLLPFPRLADDVGNWLEPLGVLSVLSETSMVILSVIVLARRRQHPAMATLLTASPQPAPRLALRATPPKGSSATATEEQPPAASRPPGRGPRMALMSVIGVGLLLGGGGAAVALDLGRDAPPQPDSVDAGFAWDMSRHHQQGVEMANLAQRGSQDPTIRLLAFDIAATQTNQVGRMEGWLSLWGLPPTNPRSSMAWMDGSQTHSMSGMAGMTSASSPPDLGPDGLMPGMATDSELAQLQSLSGNALDVQFLRLMIRHHQGALNMAQYAAAHAQLAPVRRLADVIAQTQSAETQTMLQLLSRRGGTPLPNS